ncbi:tetrachloroethene dehalogenase [Photobacterium sagamiensis]|uniref:tetrachloroethene dehalogenase n=1 Tax=Photobacterium sagamiensis TaxID=2910241 RepID=UPI003D0D3FD1
MMALMWYLLGMLTTAGVWAYVKLKAHYRLDWRAKLGLLASAGSLWFCFAWSWASFAEREPQSGAMGLLMFGLQALIIFAGTWRLFIAPANK